MMRILVITILSIIGINNSLLYSQKTQSSNTEKWFSKISFNDDLGPFETTLFFNFENSNHFTAHSFINADKRIFGSLKAKFARILNKSPKKGIFIKIKNGEIFSDKSYDSLTGILSLPMIGNPIIQGKLYNDTINCNILLNDTLIGALVAVKSNQIHPADYLELYNRIIDTTQKYIYDPELIYSRKWNQFNKKLIKISKSSLDDIEFFLGFNIHSQKLPFSHYNLFLFSEDPGKKNSLSKTNITIREINKQTVYVDISSFGGSKSEMDSAFNIILNGNYNNLIVDLRNNGGGGINSAIPFGQYLCDTTVNAGYFITNKWYSQNISTHDSLNFKTLSPIIAETTEKFIDELKNSQGVNLTIYPAIKSFKGSVYILTSSKTASTCEPIVEALKQNNLAIIVGEKTAGAMLSATTIQVMGKYFIFLPIADYYTAEYKRLDQVGVEPNISIDQEKALNYVIENLIGN